MKVLKGREFERERNFINENASTILDPANSSRTTFNNNENENEKIP